MISKKYILPLFLLFSFLGYSQSTVTGVVKDENNIPLPGVSVVIKNTTIGTSTNFDGVFSIQVKPENTLTFSMIGMVVRNIKVGNQKTINVVLNADAALLDEVIVIGYGSSSKKDLTGSVGTVKIAEIEKAVVANFDEALAGRIAGVSVTANDGTPGEARKIVIRGGNSLTSSNNPLYVINGLPLEDFDPATIPASDIESFQVLKDASATAIYGSRGANGVVVITTKSGKANSKTEITVNLSSSLQEVTNTLDVLNPYQYVKNLQTMAIARDGFQVLPNVSGSNLNNFMRRWVDPELYKDKEGRDFQKEAFRIALMSQGNFSVRGGADKTTISFSAGFVEQDGVLITTGFKRLNSNFTITQELNDKLKLRGSMNYTNTLRTGARLRNGRGNQTLKNIILFAPVDAINLSPGEIAGEGGLNDENANEYQNLYDPIKNMRGTLREDKAHNFRMNTTLTYKINDVLTLRSTNGFNLVTGRQDLFYSLDTQQGDRSENGINGRIDGYESSTISSSNTLAYQKSFNRNYLYVLAGMEYVHNTSFTSRLANKNLPTDEFGINNLDVGTQPTIAMTNAGENKLMSFFGRTILHLSNRKYLLTATLRADGSSKFRPENRWGYFPSVSGAWQIGQEDFMDNFEFINSLKVRVGWGLTGNNRIGDYNSINQFGFNIWNSYVFGDSENYQPGAVQTTFAMPDLRWETTSQTNFGLDFSMFNSRLSGTVDIYNKKTDDLLLWADMALSTGFGAVAQNVGAVSNKGVELSFSGLVVDKENFKWNSSINISTNKNEILSLNDGQTFIKSDPGLDWNSEWYYISEVGKPVGMMYGLVYDGLYQAEDFVYDPVTNPTNPYILKEGRSWYPPNVGPGHAKYLDQNGDGIINQDDRVVIGNPHPKHFGGFNNNYGVTHLIILHLTGWQMLQTHGHLGIQIPM